LLDSLLQEIVMPLYEGIGLISEKHAVVLDIGSAFTKCGYSGELSPRCIIPSKISGQWLHSVNDPAKLYAALVDFIHHLYFKWLLVNPKDRRVVVVENILGSTMFKEVLAKVLFRHYEVSSVLFVPSHLVCLFSLGVNTGLVLDIGHKEVTLLPVYQGVPILASWQAQPLAGEAVHLAVKADLTARGVVTRGGEEDQVVPVSDTPELLTDKLVEDVTLRCCFVTNINRGRQLSSAIADPSGVTSLSSCLKNSAPTVLFPVSGDQHLLIDGVTREGSTELLWAMDEDGMSVASMVLDAISASPIDCRKELAESLVLVGGMAMMPGFTSRLNQELKSLLATPKYENTKIDNFKIYQPPSKANYTAWLGGAIFGATDVVVTRSLAREQYLRDPEVPDWSNLRFNTQYLEGRQG